MKKLLIISVLFTLVLTLSACGSEAQISTLSHNPYEQVNWDEVTTINSALHNHTTNSDGDLLPHEVVDLYHSLEFGALAITDHDDNRLQYPPVTYPWTDFSTIHDSWEDRDPTELGMLSIPGTEFSWVHHMTALFTDLYLEQGYDEAAVLKAVQAEDDAIVHFAHPGRYWDRFEDYEEGERYSPEWYADFFNQYDNTVLTGIEIFSRNDFYEHDRYLWDLILSQTMPERNVFGFGVDDHHGAYARWSWTQHPLSDPMDKEAFRQNIIDGAFFAVNIRRKDDSVPTINAIDVDHDARTISIDAENYDIIRWISGYDEVTMTSTIVGEGDTFNYGSLDAPYVRAEIILGDGSTFRRKVLTQPFGLIQED